MTYRPPRHGRHGPIARVRARVAGWLDRVGRRDDEWDDDGPFTGFDCAEGVHGGDCERGCGCDCHEDVSRPEGADSPELRSGVSAGRSGERSGTGPGHPGRKDPDGMPAGWAALHEELAGHGERLPDAGERAGMFGELAPERLDAENVPGSGEGASPSGITAQHSPAGPTLTGDAGTVTGPGYFHDDAPPAMQPCGRRITECIDDVCRSGDECAWPPEDVPRPGEGSEVSGEKPMSPGPGYFHDDAPAEVVPAVQLADGSYAGLRGTIRGPLYGARRWPMPPAADTPTVADVHDQPRAGAPAWRPQRPALPGWVTDILGAPSVDAWAWGWQQRRRLAITA